MEQYLAFVGGTPLEQLVPSADVPLATISFDTIPPAITQPLESVKSQPATTSFLVAAATTPQLQTLATQKQEELNPAEFVSWAQGVGELFQEQHGGDIKEIIITDQNKHEVKEMIQQLSQKLGEASMGEKMQLREELEKNQVKMKKGSFATWRGISLSRKRRPRVRPRQ